MIAQGFLQGIRSICSGFSIKVFVGFQPIYGTLGITQAEQLVLVILGSALITFRTLGPALFCQLMIVQVAPLDAQLNAIHCVELNGVQSLHGIASRFLGARAYCVGSNEAMAVVLGTWEHPSDLFVVIVRAVLGIEDAFHVNDSAFVPFFGLDLDNLPVGVGIALIHDDAYHEEADIQGEYIDATRTPVTTVAHI